MEAQSLDREMTEAIAAEKLYKGVDTKRPEASHLEPCDPAKPACSAKKVSLICNSVIESMECEIESRLKKSLLKETKGFNQKIMVSVAAILIFSLASIACFLVDFIFDSYFFYVNVCASVLLLLASLVTFGMCLFTDRVKDFQPKFDYRLDEIIDAIWHIPQLSTYDNLTTFIDTYGSENKQILNKKQCTEQCLKMQSKWILNLEDVERKLCRTITKMVSIAGEHYQSIARKLKLASIVLVPNVILVVCKIVVYIPCDASAPLLYILNAISITITCVFVNIFFFMGQEFKAALSQQPGNHKTAYDCNAFNEELDKNSQWMPEKEYLTDDFEFFIIVIQRLSRGRIREIISKMLMEDNTKSEPPYKTESRIF